MELESRGSARIARRAWSRRQGIGTVLYERPDIVAPLLMLLALTLIFVRIPS